MVKRGHQLSGPADGASTAPPAAPAAAEPRRRVLSPPANDNSSARLKRALRAVVFVAIGAALAWLIRQVFG